MKKKNLIQTKKIIYEKIFEFSPIIKQFSKNSKIQKKSISEEMNEIFNFYETFVIKLYEKIKYLITTNIKYSQISKIIEIIYIFYFNKLTKENKQNLIENEKKMIKNQIKYSENLSKKNIKYEKYII